MASLLSRLRTELRNTFSGTGDEPPEWTQALEQGDDVGYFSPDSATWTIHSSMTPTVAGIRALLVQALHPGAMAGVHDFSSYKADPLGRLAGTIRWIFTVTYGSTDAARAGSNWVLKLHERVNGTYRDSRGETRDYSANDPHLLRWVHLAFTDAFLTAHKKYGFGIPGGPDQYVAEWARAGELMRVENPPQSEAELQAQLEEFRPELTGSDQVRDVIGFIRRPPLPRSQRLGYRVLFAGAVATLTPWQREMLGLDVPRIGPVRLPVKPAVMVVLGLIKLGLGPEGPSEEAALRRHARLAAQG
ncbi:oxygenase MpaB family protein [Arthrobacter roseus]|uniref:oxygenase MpaB family protein n=1 Tax=Arthrobacter roseus TaxID=136274 RepID=UPI001964F82E|nr:oxygenase MpaB family protein [Arthrobacter roseus]MBM7847514.1 uncharacterized protein (DUF2236 family) [Arthrobacter roseus]